MAGEHVIVIRRGNPNYRANKLFCFGLVPKDFSSLIQRASPVNISALVI